MEAYTEEYVNKLLDMIINLTSFESEYVRKAFDK